ncbi:hypothetical protein ACCS76_05925, partial [Rhizobium ruizarguesonis]
MLLHKVNIPQAAKLNIVAAVSGADSMALPVWQAEASSADDRWWLQRLSPSKDGGRERRDGVIFTADPKPVTEIMV